MTDNAYDEDNLPPFSALLGLAPNATHGMPSEDFIAMIRAGGMLCATGENDALKEDLRDVPIDASD